MENTARIHILGAAAVIVSTVKLEDWKLAEKYAPEKLIKRDENGEPVFKVMTGACTGSVNHYGVVWGNYPTEEGLATVTLLLDEDIGDKKEAVMDVAGSALLDLTEIEKEMPEVIREIQEKKHEIEIRITRIGMEKEGEAE